jgi:hypothetical protein
MATELASFKKTHPVYKLMEDAILTHANEPTTKEQIANKTYLRPAPRTFYSRYEAPMRICFGDRWTKAAQNCIFNLYKLNKLPSAQSLGLKKKGQASKSRDDYEILCVY